MKPARRMVARVLAAVVLSITPASAQVAPRTAADCARLRTLALENTTIALAEPVSGSLALPALRDSLRDLPAFCRVAGEIRPTSDSHIAFELWLPLDTWNGKLAGVGNGGWAGSISYAGPPPATLADQVRRGYAVASTNTGHEGNGGDASFAYGHPERLVDFGWRSVHETTVVAKALVNAFYGRAPQHAYWIGCSTGGKQALTEAQRFPGDYDGIVAGAPASNWVPLMTATLDFTAAAIGDSARYLPPPTLALLHEAVMKACDGLDGLEDGLLADPRRCRFDAATLQCASGTTAGCLTPGQVTAVRRIYRGVEDPVTGRKVAPGLERGSERLWAAWAAPGRPFPIPVTFFRWLAFNDSTWDWRTFDLADRRTRDVWLAADRKFTPILAATDPDLRAFRARGGKLIQYHGWNDQLISPEFSTDYYQSVVVFDSAHAGKKREALADVQQFYRLFMVPGMAHCGGGNGPGSFDMERVLEAWVERGAAPDTVLAVRFGPPGAPRVSRPLCPYPQIATYRGSGDPTDAASFTCREMGEGTRR